MPQVSRSVGILLTIVFACVAVYAVQHDLSELSSASLLAVWNLLALASLLSLGNYALRIHRWRLYLARLGHRLPLRFAGLTYIAGFAYTLSPGKVGEMVRARYYAALQVPLTDVAAAFLAERLLDVVAVVALAGLLVTASPQSRTATFAATGLAIAALAILATLPWKSLAARVTGAERIPLRIRHRLAGAARSLAGVRALLRPSMLAYGVVIGLVAWGLEGIGLDVLSSGFPAAHLPAAEGVGVYAVAVLVGGLSCLPGGLGSAEAAMTALLAGYGYPLAQALLITVLCRLATLWLAVVLGWVAVASLRERTQSA